MCRTMVRRLSTGLLSQRPVVNTRPVCVGFVVNIVALGQVFLGVLQFSSAIIHPVHQARSFICHRRHTVIPIDSEINKNEWSCASASPCAYMSCPGTTLKGDYNVGLYVVKVLFSLKE